MVEFDTKDCYLNAAPNALPPVLNRYDIGSSLCNLNESGFRHLKVLPGEVAPPSIIIGEAVVRSAEVRGGHDNRRASR